MKHSDIFSERGGLFRQHPIVMRFLLFIACPIVAIIAITFLRLNQSIAPMSGSIVVPGLNFPVDIIHDEYGVPSIHARTDHDAYFALGFKHASERLWQLEMQRRLAQGRLSEVLGANVVKHDIWMRTLGVYAASRNSIAFLSADSLSALTAYADGINTWIAQMPSLPIEFHILGIRPEPWAPVDSISWQKVFALTLGGNMYAELRRIVLRKNFSDEQIRYFYPYDPAFKSASTDAIPAEFSLIANSDLMLTHGIGHPHAGSNAWVISGRHTRSGQPILANDPHLGLHFPSLWYAASMKGEKLDVSGMTLVGLPLVILGQNANIAWGGTNLMSDQQDLFVETISPEHPNKYRRGQTWVPFEEREEIISISAAFPTRLREPITPVKVVVRKSDIGPVVSDSSSPGNLTLSLRWAALDEDDRSLESFFEIQYAKNWEEFRRALKKLKAPGLNVLYADRSGNIGHQVAGMIPRRKQGNGTIPTNASDGAAWEGYQDYESLPFAFNPDQGFIVNANNSVKGSSNINISHEWAAPERRDRIVSLLDEYIGAGLLMTVDDMRKIQTDSSDLAALSLLAHLASTKAETASEEEALAFLKVWDGAFSPESVGASLFATWAYYLRKEILADELSGNWQNADEFELLNSSIELIDWSQLAKIVSSNRHGWCQVSTESPCSLEKKSSLKKALTQLAKITGTASVAKWQWARVSSTDFVHQPFGVLKGFDLFFRKSTDSVASPNSIKASNLVFDEFDGFLQTFGPGFRQIFELNESRSQWYMLSTGQSGNPMSPHFSDMIIPFSNGYLKKMATDKSSAKVLTLLPIPK